MARMRDTGGCCPHAGVSIIEDGTPRAKVSNVECRPSHVGVVY